MKISYEATRNEMSVRHFMINSIRKSYEAIKEAKLSNLSRDKEENQIVLVN